MPPPHSPALIRLQSLESSPSDFGDKLVSILFEQEYALPEEHFEQDDLVWLIDYLDEVRPSSPSSAPCSSQFRLSAVSTLPAQLSRNASTNSRIYAARRRSSPNRTNSRLNAWKLNPRPPPLEGLVTYIMGPSIARRSAYYVSVFPAKPFSQR